MTLVDEISALSELKIKAAAEVYRALINRGDSPHPGDAVKLASAMATLGLSEADAAQDLSAVRQVRQDEAELLTAETLKSLSVTSKAVLANAAREFRDEIRLMLESAELQELQNVFRICWTTIHGVVNRNAQSAKEDLILRKVSFASGEEYLAANKNRQLNERIKQTKLSAPMMFPEMTSPASGESRYVHASRPSGR